MSDAPDLLEDLTQTLILLFGEQPLMVKNFEYSIAVAPRTELRAKDDSWRLVESAASSVVSWLLENGCNYYDMLCVDDDSHVVKFFAPETRNLKAVS